jgi:cold shock CspA family protein
MTQVKVLWFNATKQYGEGQTSDNRRVFLHADKLPKGIPLLKSDQFIQCELALEEGHWVADRIELASATPTPNFRELPAAPNS